MTSPYRSDQTARREHLRARSLQCEAEQARFDPRFWSVQSELWKRVQAASSRIRSLLQYEGDIAALESTLDNLEDALARARELVPGIQDWFRHPKPGHPQRPGPEHAPTTVPLSNPLHEWRETLDAAVFHVRQCDPIATLYAREYRAFGRLPGDDLLTRFEAVSSWFLDAVVLAELQQVPISVWVALRMMKGVRVTLRAETFVAPGLPRLSMQPQGGMDDLLQAVGLQSDVRTLDSDFDSMYRIDFRGEVDELRELLPNHVRSNLVDIGAFDVPRVKIADGVASIEWNFAPNRALSLAMNCLCFWRALIPPVELLASG